MTVVSGLTCRANRWARKRSWDERYTFVIALWRNECRGYIRSNPATRCQCLKTVWSRRFESRWPAWLQSRGASGATDSPDEQFVPPEPLQLRQEGIREEDVADSATLGDLTAQPNPASRPAVCEVDIPDVQADDFRQP